MSSRPEEYQRENRYCWICCVDASHPEAVPPSTLSSMQVSRANEVALCSSSIDCRSVKSPNVPVDTPASAARSSETHVPEEAQPVEPSKICDMVPEPVIACL